MHALVAGLKRRELLAGLLTGRPRHAPPTADAGAIYDPSGWPREQRPIPSPVKAGQLQQMSFASGSMAPKVAAACRFVTATGGKAAVGSIGDALHILQGRAGTVIEA